MPFRTVMRLLAILVLTAFASLKAHAYDAIIVFGDSYNDVGNIYAIAAKLGIDYPPKPYYMGRFSNGPIWVEHLASDWGLPLTPSVTGGTDFAEGGAQLLKPVTLEGLPIPSVQEQLAAYLALNGNKADPNALYVIEGGGNDILDSTSFSPNLGSDIAFGLFTMVDTLRAAGAKNFLVPDLIDVGQLPAAAVGGAPFVKFASDASLDANKELGQLLQQEWHFHQVSILRIPSLNTFLAVANAKAHFGFVDVTTPCLSSTLVLCADPDHTLWWDEEHPTEFGHAFFAVLVEGALARY